jgi:hypothetical protein
MAEGNSKRYFKYAIGEIVLVVIGILIALQINNWNEERKATMAENKLLTALNREFKLNRQVLANDIKDLDTTIHALSTMLKIMSNDINTDYRGKQLDSLLILCIANYQWESSDFALKELETSSRFSELQNEALKPLIYDWSRHLRQIDKNSGESYKSFDYLLNYLKAHGSLRQMDLYDNYLSEGPSVLRANNDHLLTDPIFENAIDDYIVFTRQLQESYVQAVEKLDKIIEVTE